MKKQHHIVVDTQQLPCCDNPSHFGYVARCTCDWESRPVREREDMAGLIQAHRIDVLERAVGIRFGVEWKR